MRRAFLGLIFLSAAAPAFAQQPEKIPLMVFDAHAAFVSLGHDALTAASLGATSEDLAGHGLGLLAGLHVYPLRGANVALGVGGELVLVRAAHQAQDQTTGLPIGPEIDRRFQSLSGQVSLNFGHQRGWSYISGGTGPVAFDTYPKGSIPDSLRTMTVNYGGGARWFNTKHLAFSLDLRFYLTKAAPPTLIVAERAKTKLLVISAGISMK